MVWYGMVWYGMVWYGMVGPVGFEGLTFIAHPKEASGHPSVEAQDRDERGCAD